MSAVIWRAGSHRGVREGVLVAWRPNERSSRSTACLCTCSDGRVAVVRSRGALGFRLSCKTS